MYEIQNLPSDGVKWEPAKIEFTGFEEYKQIAVDIADYIDTIDLTPENVKDVKKVLADARKVTDGLNRRRIDIKKDIASEYKVFEGEVNELIKVIDAADSRLRNKVRDLEEAEREAKKKQIKEIWDKRVIRYRINEYFPDAFGLWITPQHLNKSMSMKAVEASMTDWLEDTEKAFETLDGMDDEYTVEYLSCWDLATAIQNVNEREERRELVSSNTDEDETEPFVLITVKGEKDIKLAKYLLEENCINFEVL